MAKVLADTSAWIASFSKTGHESLKEAMREAIHNGSLVMAGLVLFELLQGVRHEAAFEALRKKLQVLPLLPTPESIWCDAARRSLVLRSKGVQAGAPDILIASLAMEHSCVLLHCDWDYEHMKKHLPLNTMAFLP